MDFLQFGGGGLTVRRTWLEERTLGRATGRAGRAGLLGVSGRATAAGEGDLRRHCGSLSVGLFRMFSGSFRKGESRVLIRPRKKPSQMDRVDWAVPGKRRCVFMSGKLLWCLSARLVRRRD